MIESDNPLSRPSSVLAVVETNAHGEKETIPGIWNSVGSFASVMPGCLPPSVVCEEMSHGVGGKTGGV